MRLLLIRHGAAADREPGMSDDARTLTPEGKKEFRKAARGLARIYDAPDLVLTSPLPRARQTAEIASAAWGGVRVEETAALQTGSFEELDKALGQREGCVALVGHEPHLSSLLARLVAGSRPDLLAFKKGGVAVVDVPGRLKGGGLLVAVLPPKLLRQLAV
jgi:phosphohistidine phosphatase